MRVVSALGQRGVKVGVRREKEDAVATSPRQGGDRNEEAKVVRQVTYVCVGSDAVAVRGVGGWRGGGRGRGEGGGEAKEDEAGVNGS